MRETETKLPLTKVPSGLISPSHAQAQPHNALDQGYRNANCCHLPATAPHSLGTAAVPTSVAVCELLRLRSSRVVLLSFSSSVRALCGDLQCVLAHDLSLECFGAGAGICGQRSDHFQCRHQQLSTVRVARSFVPGDITHRMFQGIIRIEVQAIHDMQLRTGGNLLHSKMVMWKESSCMQSVV